MWALAWQKYINPGRRLRRGGYLVFREVADHGLDGGPSFELALDLRGEAALLAGGVDLEPVIGRRVVAAIAGIGDAAIEHVADERFHLRNDRGERVSVIGIAR